MKKLCLLIFLTAATTSLWAQKEKETESTEASKKNVVKINLFAIALKNISIQYERAVAGKVTVAGTFRFMPKGAIPMKSSVIDLADDPETARQINNLRVGDLAFMPELRYYLSKKGAFRGFYLGLYANIAKYNADLVYEYDDAGTTKTIPMTGHITLPA